MAKRNLRPITLALVVGSREFFNGAPALETRRHLVAQLEKLGVGYNILPIDATKNGAVQSRDDARLYAAQFRGDRDSIDGLIISLPNFGDEIAIMELVTHARLGVPILLQASNDEIDKVDVASRRDAFCGKFSIANNFYQYGVPFTDTTSHTRQVLIFDPTTSRLLAEEKTVVEGNEFSWPSGTIMDSTTYLVQAVVGSNTEVPAALK